MRGSRRWLIICLAGIESNALTKVCFRKMRKPARGTRALPTRFAGDTSAATGLMFFVAEEAAVADEVGNLRRDHVVPAFVAGGDALEDVP
jgi:hypothetical protein